MKKTSNNRNRRDPAETHSPASEPDQKHVETPSQEHVPMAESTLHVVASGQWMDPSELRQWAIEQLTTPSSDQAPHNLILDLSGVDHLDSSALQILLAVSAEEKQRGGSLHLVNPSESLRRWFDYAGAASLLALAAPPSSTLTEEASRCEKF